MKYIAFFLFIGLFNYSCKPEEPVEEPYIPTSYTLEIPEVFKDRVLPPVIPVDNPMTVEGISLGKKLFYDPLLSGDGSQSCASCHNQKFGFSEDTKFSTGIDEIEGTRNAMPLFNMAWNYEENFFWDGRVSTIEGQAKEPVINPIEMHSVWDDVVDKLQSNKDYPVLFKKAFGTDKISIDLTVKAIAQFERTIISANSKFDKYLRHEVDLTYDERIGYQIFEREEKGDCFHCHGSIHNPLWTDNRFHNNGIDSVSLDIGREEVTGNPADQGKFRTPSLRNLKYTAPYMHDGRFATLDEVIEQYSEHVYYGPLTDPLMQHAYKGGVHLTDKEKQQLKAFLLTLSDETYITNQEYGNK